MHNHNILFTVLLPIHRSPELLLMSVESVLSQTIQSFELFIICDGAPQSTIEYANTLMKKDDRIRVFDFPKGKRLGEAHRHVALMQAHGEYIAQIADDDLWFPNHLEEIEKLLQKVDFGNLTDTYVSDANNADIYLEELDDPAVVTKMLTTPFNFFGPTVCGYRLSAYKKLVGGWSPAPQEIVSDLHMWRKFLATPGINYGTRFAITSIHLPAPCRKNMSIAERASENHAWSEKIKSPIGRDAIIQAILRRYARHFIYLRDN